MFGRQKKQPLSRYDAFWALRRLLLERRPQIASWDPSQTGMVQQATLDLLHEQQTEGTDIGRTLSDEDISQLWDDGLPASDWGGLQGHDRYDKEEGGVQLGPSKKSGDSDSGGAGYRLNKGIDN